MKVVLFCGGLGLRIRDAEGIPKPMVPVGFRPILWHLMRYYAHYGHKDFILCLGYKGEMIKEYFLNYQALNNDFTICLGQREGITFHGQDDQQGFQVTLVDTGGLERQHNLRQVETFYFGQFMFLQVAVFFPRPQPEANARGGPAGAAGHGRRARATCTLQTFRESVCGPGAISIRRCPGERSMPPRSLQRAPACPGAAGGK